MAIQQHRYGRTRMIVLLFSALLYLFDSSTAFILTPRWPITSRRSRIPSSRTILFALPDIQSMRVGEIRQELESYGISTKSFLEKKELIEALQQARAQGKTPKKSSTTTTTVNGARQQQQSSSSSSSSRDERIKEEMAKAKSMKVGDLKKELQAMGVSTKSFFEKSEFVKAYAQAKVDGATKKKTTRRKDENYDPSFRDVVMEKMDPRDPRLMQGTVIDVTAKR